MPIHDLGYRGWSGKRISFLMRPVVVARGGVMLVLKRRWLRLMLVLAWLPVLFPAFGIFVFESTAMEPGAQETIAGLMQGPLGRPDLAALMLEDPELARHDVWATLILTFFRYPQLFAMVGLIGVIAPLLVSYDLRTKAYLMYFSRPLTPTQYIIGKSAVIWFFLAGIATIPALMLYGVGILLSSDLSVIAQTWDLPFRILFASVVLLVPTTTLALLYSSLTAESRYATFAWFATWVMGLVAYQILTVSPVLMSGPDSSGPNFDTWRLISPYHMLGKVQAWIFGLDPTPGSVVPSIMLLTTVTVFGFLIVRRRIIARLSV